MTKNRSERMPHLTDCGLPGVKDIPYGVHMCHFYRDKDELAAALVPYFAAGLRANERCIWITAAPLPAHDAKAALAASAFDFEREVARGALVIRDHDDWYADPAALQGHEVVERWLDEERRALANHYSGLRITGNVTFLRPEDWEVFMEYERLVQHAFQGRRIVTLCTYALHRCGASEVLDVMRRHSCTLDRPDEGWQILTAA